MSRWFVIAVLAASLTAAGCGGATRAAGTATVSPVFPALVSAVATFVSTEHGKDADSPLTVDLLRSNAELAGNLHVIGTKFDDNSSSGPFSFSLSGPFTLRDIDTGQLRVRFVPDGADEWTFDLHLNMRFTDGAGRNFLWRGVRLDNTSPERVLALAPARFP
ncbi:MAG: hypothetical protein HYU37_13880 [Acidobacteria bacterium]|nr:hypothetical protein [Acidobacteriota bacterium]